MTYSAQPLSKTKIYRVLANSRRRHALQILCKSNSSIPLADLAADIASRELDESDETDNEEYIERVLISLYHTHVPKLEDMGIVEFNATKRTVSLSDSEESHFIQNQILQTQ